MSNTQELVQQANNRMVDALQENKKLKEKIAELESLIKECDNYLDINRYMAIGNMSILHRKMKQLLNKGGEL